MPPWPSKNFLEKPCDSHEEPCRWGRYIVGHGSNQAISELMSEQILSKQDGDLRCLMHDERHIDDRIIVKFYSIICHGFISVFIAFSKACSSFFSHKVIGSDRATLCLKDAATFLALSCKRQVSDRIQRPLAMAVWSPRQMWASWGYSHQPSTSAMCNSLFSRHFGSSFRLTYSKQTSLPVGASNRWGHAA